MNRKGRKLAWGFSFALVAVLGMVVMAYAGSETKAVEGKSGKSPCCARMGAMSKGGDSQGSESNECESKGSESKSCPMASAGCKGCESAKVTVTGENVCVSCSLKKGKGAAAQCKVYGHRHGLRVGKIECESQKAGKCCYSSALLHYLENDQSKDLIQGNDGKQVEVTGMLYGPESVLQVDSFKVLEGAGSESRGSETK